MQPRLPPSRLLQGAVMDGQIEDHAHAQEAIAALRGVRDVGGARTVARDASVFLRAHMNEEEHEDGVFPWLVALRPDLGPEIDRLVAEHMEIRAAVAALLAAPDEDVVTAAHSLADQLEEHEAAERVALDRAVGRV